MVYEYTRPRAEIAAMYSSPGPCYALPGVIGHRHHDPRSTHTKRPAWGFGIRHVALTNDSSPGPVHYPNPKTTRKGTDGVPKYSLYSRPVELVGFRNPGPGAYSPEKAGPSSSPRAPLYSLGARTKVVRTDTNPAPNSYSLPQLLGMSFEGDKPSAPRFSMTGRAKMGGFDEDLQRTPGPGAYGVTDPDLYQNKRAAYSMRPKCVLPGDTSDKPGPGAHSPERVQINRSSAPRYSFGIRHSQYMAPLIVETIE